MRPMPIRTTGRSQARRIRTRFRTRLRTSFHVLVVCETDCQTRAGLSGWFKIYRARITLGDDVPPTGDVTGPLVERPLLRGTVSATVNGHDTGGGVYLAAGL